MKNMMSQVKNCNPSSLRPLVLCTLSLCTLLCSLLLPGCKDKEPETFVNDVSAPAWVTSDNYDYTSSMTAVVKVDLKAQYPEKAADFLIDSKDQIGAFSGDTCLGIASPQSGVFFLYIAGTEGEISLRYYSAYYKNLFEAKDAFTFQNDANLGTVAEPFTPTWTVAK